MRFNSGGSHDTAKFTVVVFGDDAQVNGSATMNPKAPTPNAIELRYERVMGAFGVDVPVVSKQGSSRRRRLWSERGVSGCRGSPACLPEVAFESGHKLTAKDATEMFCLVTAASLSRRGPSICARTYPPGSAVAGVEANGDRH